MNLTDHQSTKLQELIDCPSEIVALIGEAGVGKSWTISELIQHLMKDGNNVAVTGTTHRAVANLYEMCGIEGKTIHSFLGMRMVYKGAECFLKPNKNHTPDPDVDYLIIDELSMMTNQLMARLKEYISLYGIEKVILIGDPIQLQLPGSIDPTSIPQFELTQQMRQTNTPNVSAALKALRFAIDNNTELGALFEEGPDLHVYESHHEFLKIYKESPKEKMFICYQNSVVSTYNVNVKKYINEDEDRFSVGDEIYPTSPIIKDGKVKITNREKCIITEVEESDNHYELTTFRGVISVAKTKTILQEYLDSLASARNWKEFYRIKDEFADVHHTWAGTAHSAQGASIDEVFIDYTDMAKILNSGKMSDLYRILYVGMSRCKSTVHIYTGEERSYKSLGTYKKRS